jgi:hypothetical protein
MDILECGTKFSYKGFGGCDSHCYIKIFGNRVLCTEAPDNHGTSVTNIAEGIATEVCRTFDIPMRDLIWFEHYFEDKECNLPERYSIVEFKISNNEFRNPQWSYADTYLTERLFK